MKHIRELTARIRAYVLERIPETDQSDRSLNARAQELCLKYDIIYHLEEIIKLMFREKFLRTWPDAFMEMVLTLRVVSMNNHANSCEIYPILDLMIRSEP